MQHPTVALNRSFPIRLTTKSYSFRWFETSQLEGGRGCLDQLLHLKSFIDRKADRLSSRCSAIRNKPLMLFGKTTSTLITLNYRNYIWRYSEKVHSTVSDNHLHYRSKAFLINIIIEIKFQYHSTLHLSLRSQISVTPYADLRTRSAYKILMLSLVLNWTMLSLAVFTTILELAKQ